MTKICGEISLCNLFEKYKESISPCSPYLNGVWFSTFHEEIMVPNTKNLLVHTVPTSMVSGFLRDHGSQYKESISECSPYLHGVWFSMFHEEIMVSNTKILLVHAVPTSMVSGFLRFMKRSWFPIQRSR